MISFAYPILLLLLILIPVIGLLYYFARFYRKKKLEKFGSYAEVCGMMPDVSKYKPAIKFYLRLFALIFIIIAAARPWGNIIEQGNNKEGIEVVLAIDASNSMLASTTDDPADPSRMVSAKLLLERLIDNLSEDRVGLVEYAARAYNLIPVSSDYTSAKTFLNSIDPRLIESQGTNISEAIKASVTSFSDDKNIGKAIVLLTDAEELENTSDVLNAVKEARKNNIQINVIGVGSTNGAVIPYDNRVLTDDSGNTVKTTLNEELAKEIAKTGGGIYVNASDSDALSAIQKKLKEIKRTAMKGSILSVHEELYSYFIWVALLLLLADSFITLRKNAWLNKITFFRKEN